MELLQLRYFCTVAACSNITHAAHFHNIPQPAMSKTISRLEKELGTTLFNRSKNRLTLTRSGEELFKSVSEGLRTIDEAVSNLYDTTEIPKQDIHLLALSEQMTIVNCLLAFKRTHPNVFFSVKNTADIHSQDFDYCIATHAPYSREYTTLPLLEERLMLAVPFSHRLAGKKTVHLSELRNEEFIFDRDSSDILQITTSHTLQYGFEPRIFAYTGDLFSLREYLLNGLGVTIIPEISWWNLFRRDAAIISVDEPRYYYNTFLYYDENRPQSRIVKEFGLSLSDYYAALERASQAVISPIPHLAEDELW